MRNDGLRNLTSLILLVRRIILWSLLAGLSLFVLMYAVPQLWSRYVESAQASVAEMKRREAEAAFTHAQFERELQRQRMIQENAIRLEQERQFAVLKFQAAQFFVYFIMVAAVLLLFVLLVLLWHRRHSIVVVRQDEIPVSRVMLASGQAHIDRALSKQNVGLVSNQDNRVMALDQPPSYVKAPAVIERQSDQFADLALSEVTSTAKKGELIVGQSFAGEPIRLPMTLGYHMLAHGDTRSGKTNWLDSQIVQLHWQFARGVPLEVIAGDFKRELSATWSRSPLMPFGVAKTVVEITEMLQQVVYGPDGILDRYDLFERVAGEYNRVVRNLREYAAVTNTTPRFRYVVIDEINALLEAADSSDGLDVLLKQILQMGAGAGVFVVGGAQYLTAKTFGRDGSKQFVTRMHFGFYDPAAIQMMFGVVPPEARQFLDATPGRGLIRTVTMPVAQVFQAYRCDEDDILGAIETAGACELSRVLSSDASPQPNKLSDVDALAASISLDTPEDLARLLLLRQKSMNEIQRILGKRREESLAITAKALRKLVTEMLSNGWSEEQICAAFPKTPKSYIQALVSRCVAQNGRSDDVGTLEK